SAWSLSRPSCCQSVGRPEVTPSKPEVSKRPIAVGHERQLAGRSQSRMVRTEHADGPLHLPLNPLEARACLSPSPASTWLPLSPPPYPKTSAFPFPVAGATSPQRASSRRTRALPG